MGCDFNNNNKAGLRINRCNVYNLTINVITSAFKENYCVPFSFIIHEYKYMKFV